MSRWREVEVTGWGRAQRARGFACRPERARDAVEAMREVDRAGEQLLIRGAGRSYGDLALNRDGRILLTERLDRFLELDESGPSLVCEPGVTFRDILEVLGPRGYLFPVSPGTAETTVAGAVACDVHGKSHEHDGSFGSHVEWIDLALPDGEVRRISPSHDPELFAATVGGLGLTGLMLRVRFRLVRVPSLRLELREQRLPDLDAFLEACEEARHTATFSAGWVDGLARGRSLGRGILETAEFAPPEGGPDPERGKTGAVGVTPREGTASGGGDPGPADPRRRRRVPFDAPPGLLNRLSVGAFNALYHRRVSRRGRQRVVPLAEHFYPLDAIADWNRFYGRRGFHQFQGVVPDETARPALRDLLETASQGPVRPFLGVLKSMGPRGRGYISFPRPGYTLALDFPHRDETADVFRRMHDVVLEHGGRVYLAKDSFLTPEDYRTMYPYHEEYRAVLERADPAGRLSSDLARRLELRR